MFIHCKLLTKSTQSLPRDDICRTESCLREHRWGNSAKSPGPRNLPDQSYHQRLNSCLRAIRKLFRLWRKRDYFIIGGSNYLSLLFSNSYYCHVPLILCLCTDSYQNRQTAEVLRSFWGGGGVTASFQVQHYVYEHKTKMSDWVHSTIVRILQISYSCWDDGHVNLQPSPCFL